MSRFEPKVRWWTATTRSLSRFALSRRPHAQRRLSLEYLEDRTMLSTTVPLTVNTLADDPTGVRISGYTTLRDAITQADNDPAKSYAINFSVSAPGMIDLTSSLPDLSNNIDVEGPGASDLTVAGSIASGAPSFSIFTIDANVQAKLVGLTITGGSGDVVNLANGGTEELGGGICNSGTLTVSNSNIRDNQAINYSYGSSYGGGIYNTGTLTVFNSTVEYNSAGIRSNSASVDYGNSCGGGIYNTGTLTVFNSTIYNNQAVSDVSGGGSYCGGGIYNTGTLTVSNSIIDNNQAVNGDYGSGNYGGGIYNTGTLNLVQCTLSGNVAFVGLVEGNVSYGSGGDAFGGAVYTTGDLTLDDCTVSNNTAEGGAGFLEPIRST